MIADFDQLGLRVLQLRRRSMALPGRMVRSMQDHERLYEAFERRDPETASLVARSIIRDAYQALAGANAKEKEWRI